MLGIKTKRFFSLAARLLPFFMAASSAITRADTTIDITPQPIVFDPALTHGLSDRERASYSKTLADAWVRDYGSGLRVVRTANPYEPSNAPANGPQTSASTTLSSLGDSGPEALSKLVVQVLHFANGVTSRSDSFQGDFRALFLHAIGLQNTGFAWVVLAERTGFDLDWLSGFRAGGGAGIQIPVLGSTNITLKNGSGQVAVRILPIAGNYEAVTSGKDSEHLTADSNSGLVLRPSAEIEAAFRYEGVQPGIRFLAQPRLMQPNEMRMIAEVYVTLDINTGDPYVNKVSIIPRCMMDFSNDRQVPGGTGPTLAYQEGYSLLNRETSCSISAGLSFTK